MSYQGTTGNSNEITEEGTTNNNNEITEEGAMPSSSITSGSNINYEEHVAIFVAYNGTWEWDGKEWLFKDFKGSVMVVSRHIKLSQLTDILERKLSVLGNEFRLKLEVHYKVGSLAFPVIEIEDNQDLSVFISETSKTKIPLCVTRVLKYGAVRIRHDTVEEEYKHERKALYKAIKENREKAREIVNTSTKEVTWTSKLNDDGYTALHFAVGRYKDNEIVREILMGINRELLVTTVNIRGETPVHTATAFGNTEALKIMLDYNPTCSFIHNNDGDLAIHYALEICSKRTFLYLFNQMKSCRVEYDELFRSMRGLNLLHQVIDKGLIDVAYELINEFPILATMEAGDETTLERIIKRPELFNSGIPDNMFSRYLYSHVPTENNSFGSTDTADVENQETPKNDKFFTKYTRKCLHDASLVKHFKDEKVKHNTTIKLLRRICEEADKTYTESDIELLYSSPFCLAVENNNPDAVDVLATYFAGLYNSKKDGRNIYQLIVLNRSEKVYNYVLHHDRFAKSGFSLSLDDDNNNILHLAGRLAPRHKLIAAFGPALQMQRELRWFEELKRVVGITKTQELNKNKETPMMVFREEHMELRKDGEEWIKRTADSYTVTAALIIAIVFAAAITVPGGNDSATGKPIYETKASLIIFAISVAISLFTATTSLLLFLSVITSRYADEDFRFKLPNTVLILGLLMLIASVTSMMIAFSAALYIMFGQGKAWILIPIAALAWLPYSSFGSAQFPLVFELISSTYGNGI